MARVEMMLVAVLIALALFVGILFGGGSIWFLKPAGTGAGGVVEKAVNRYVCYDGSVKDAQAQCPVVSTGTDGKTQVVCPPCENTATGSTTCSPFRKCDYTQCQAQFGIGIAPTTTLAPPKCAACTTNAECGQPGDSDLRCKNDEVYRTHFEPFCDTNSSLSMTGGGCCLQKETYKAVQTCSDTQRCYKGKGCVAYTDAPEE
jgi:hypothetical protein